MKRLVVFACGLLAGAALMLAWPLRAHDLDSSKKAVPGNNPLFINMTTGDSWRGWMGLHFAHATLKMGHPVAVFLNLDAVKLAVKRGSRRSGRPCSASRARSSPTSSRMAALS